MKSSKGQKYWSNIEEVAKRVKAPKMGMCGINETRENMKTMK